MPHSTSDFWAAINAPVNRGFHGLEADVEEQAMDIFDASSDDEPVYSFVEYGGPQSLELKAENAAAEMKDIRQGPVKSWNAIVHAAALTISVEAASDTKNRNSKITQAAGAMGRAVNITPELIAALFLDRAFNSAYPEAPDQLELCSTVHTLPDEVTTYANELATPDAFGETTCEDIRTALRTIKGPDGNIQPRKVKGWIVPAALYDRARKLSMNDKTSGSANNDPSVVKGTKVLPLDYLSSNTRFFAKTDHPNGLFWHWIQKKTFVTDQVALNLQKVFLAWFRSRIGCKNPRAIFGVAAT